MALGNSFEAEGAEVATDTASALLEARREVRVGAQHPVEVYCSSFDLPLAAQVRDISAGGMCIATPSPIPVEKLAGVGLQLPGGNLRINAAGVWQTRMSMDESVLTGLTFIRPEPFLLLSLREWVDACVRDVGGFLSEVLRSEKIGFEDCMLLAQSTRVRVIPRGRCLYQRGESPADRDDSIFFVREGLVELSIPRQQGSPHVTAQLGPFSLLGGLGCVASMPHFEDAQALEDTTVLEISRPAFAYLRIAQPLLAHWLSQVVMVGQLQRVDGLVARLS
ncbi:MAG: cyclic nucleotide-binding domain-containing protein [Myxococcota bacterium]|nr:cyclic nucleotide-binding domain-containing protein [Myxococcota bacterium]